MPLSMIYCIFIDWDIQFITLRPNSNIFTAAGQKRDLHSWDADRNQTRACPYELRCALLSYATPCLATPHPLEQHSTLSCILFRRMVRNGILRVCFYFCSTERNSELFSLQQKGPERDFESLLLFMFHGREFRVVLFRRTARIPSEITICSVDSVFRGIIFLSEISNPTFQLNSDPVVEPVPDAGFWWWPKMFKKNSWKQINIFLIKTAIYLSLDLHKGRPCYRRSLQPS